MSCDCPFCPLVALNFQTHDTLVKLLSTGKETYEAKICLRDYIADHQKKERVVECLGQLAAYCKYQKKLIRLGTAITLDNSEFEMTISVVAPNIYKVCFHTKQRSEGDATKLNAASPVVASA